MTNQVSKLKVLGERSLFLYLLAKTYYNDNSQDYEDKCCANHY